MSSVKDIKPAELNDAIRQDALIERQALGWYRSVSIIATAVGLMGIGAVMTYSASVKVDSLTSTTVMDERIVRQFAFVLAGLFAMMVVARIPYRIWAAGNGLAAVIGLAVAVCMTLLVFVPGIGMDINNARRWIKVSGGYSLQPSELVKIMLPIFLAVWMTRGLRPGPTGMPVLSGKQTDIRKFIRGLVPAMLVIGISVGVVGIEDFGTAALIAAVSGAMLLVGGARLTHLTLLGMSALPVFAYLLKSRTHRMSRLTSFMDIWEDPEGKSYQVLQSLCTIASGDFSGRGLGRGFVKHYLPEARTDFIFSVICEEFGVIGATMVIALFIVFLWQCRSVIRDCADPMGRLLAFGIAMTIGVQAAMNIAVVTVSVPTKGISLPLVSAGGSGVIFLGILVGILASIPRYGGLQSRGKG